MECVPKDWRRIKTRKGTHSALDRWHIGISHKTPRWMTADKKRRDVNECGEVTEPRERQRGRESWTAQWTHPTHCTPLRFIKIQTSLNIDSNVSIPNCQYIIFVSICRWRWYIKHIIAYWIDVTLLSFDCQDYMDIDVQPQNTVGNNEC